MIVRYVPSWMPGAGFKTFAKEASGLHRRMRDAPFEVVKTQMVRVTGPYSKGDLLIYD
jgi:hypothetical protein